MIRERTTATLSNRTCSKQTKQIKILKTNKNRWKGSKQIKGLQVMKRGPQPYYPPW